MKTQMTRDELAAIVTQIHALFRGDTDREILRLALPRIAEMRLSAALAALNDYAMDWGGKNSRFIVGKFFEYAAKVTRASSETRERDQRIARSIAKTREQIEVDLEWEALRDVIRRAHPESVEEALEFLAHAGWTRPSESVESWSRSLVLAVGDLVASKTRYGYSADTGGFTVAMSAEAFWGQMRPPSVAMSR